MLMTGAIATKENWRDNYQTPLFLLDKISEFWPLGWNDPCPAYPVQDGLKITWQRYSYINPPFSQYKQWVEWGLKGIRPQIWLCNSNTETSWYQALCRNSDAMLLFNFRLKFIDLRTGKAAASPRQGQTLFYRGKESIRFLHEFQEFGFGVPLQRKV